MAKCDEGYLCEVCKQEVEDVTESHLYLAFVIGELDPELLHVSPECHIRCNPIVAQFIVDAEFESVNVEGDFDKRTLDSDYVRRREQLVTRGWRRLREIAGKDLPIIEYPLLEVQEELRRRARND